MTKFSHLAFLNKKKMQAEGILIPSFPQITETKIMGLIKTPPAYQEESLSVIPVAIGGKYSIQIADGEKTILLPYDSIIEIASVFRAVSTFNKTLASAHDVESPEEAEEGRLGGSEPREPVLEPVKTKDDTPELATKGSKKAPGLA
ncbi:MAG: hypothetical protein ACRC80_08580 [Waterburya sp.]